MTYSLPGYTTASRSVDLSGDNTQSVTLSVPVVPVTRTLSGYITNSAGTPLAGVSVQVGGAGSGKHQRERLLQHRGHHAEIQRDVLAAGLHVCDPLGGPLGRQHPVGDASQCR